MNSGLVDIHVLEETVSRVSELTQSITKQVTVVEQVSDNANKALGPASQQSKAIGQYRDNLFGLMKIFEQIEHTTKDINDLEAAIAAGPAKSGWQNYISLVQHAQELSTELSLNPYMKRFPQLPESATAQFHFGISNLLNYVRRLGKAVFTPIDGAKYLVNVGEALPQFKPDELVALSKLILALDEWPDMAEGADNALMAAVEGFYSQSCSSVLPRMGARTGQFSIQAVSELLEQYREVVNNGIQILFNRNPTRLRKFMDANSQISHRMNSSAQSQYTASLAKGTGSLKTAPKSSTNTSGAVHKGQPAAQSQKEGTTSIDAESNKVKLSGGQQPNNSTEKSTNATVRPDLSLNTQRDSPNGVQFSYANSPMTPDAAKSPHAGTFATPKTVPTISVNSPGSSPAYNSAPEVSGSPLTGHASGTTSAAAQQWASLETIEKSRHNEISADDMSHAKQASVVTLVNVFQGIEQITRRSPITSEFGVSGASIQFMQTLKQLSQLQHGVDVVLSEMPTRGYLSKPPPMWAQRSEPTAAGRANPVSQYNADIVDCLYANLHQVSRDQLKDTTRVGIFMLSNLSAIEHYITDSKDQTLQTAHGKSPLMEAMGDVALQRFSRLLDASFKEYLTDWSKLASVLMESTMTTGGTQGKLSSKDREAIKEKFRVFNAEFERLTERQRKYQVVDPVLRERMGSEVRKLIGPLYMRFYQKHSHGDFTKNLGKYLKYDMNAFNRALMF